MTKNRTLDVMRRKKSMIHGLSQLMDVVDVKDASMVEVGCYQGESTEIFCKSDKIILIHAVDMWRFDPEESPFYVHSNFALVESAFDKRVKPFNKVLKMKMKSVEAAKQIPDASIDIVYIDADHRYESVLQDIAVWTPKVKGGGYMAGHDYGAEEVRKAINELLGIPMKTFKDTSWVFKL